MLAAEQYVRVHGLMCREYEFCDGCPLRTAAEESGEVFECCIDFKVRYPAEAVKLVHLWWNENRHRYPQYERKTDGVIPSGYPGDQSGESLKLWSETPDYIAEKLREAAGQNPLLAKMMESEKRDDPV